MNRFAPIAKARGTFALSRTVVILSTLVGTSLFATLADPKAIIAPPLRIAVGLVSVLAAVLAATQTFLWFAERSGRHA